MEKNKQLCKNISAKGIFKVRRKLKRIHGVKENTFGGLFDIPVPQ